MSNTKNTPGKSSSGAGMTPSVKLFELASVSAVASVGASQLR